MNSKQSIGLVLICALISTGAAIATVRFLPVKGSTAALENKINMLEQTLQATRDNQQELSGQAGTSSISQSSEKTEQSPTRDQILESISTTDLVDEIEKEYIRRAEEAQVEYDQTTIEEGHYLKQALRSGGLNEEEINLVISQNQALELENLYERHALQRKELQENPQRAQQWLARSDSNAKLRDRLGQDLYERQLKAQGYPLNAQVNSVITGSPAALAGFQSGDKITHYGGRRIYNMRELSMLTLQGNEGEAVVVELERDGAPMQITLPRGPLGVSSNIR